MTKPLNMTISQQQLLFTLTGSSMGDNFFIKCHQRPTSLVIDGLFSSVLDWIAFYFIGQAAVFMLLSLPVVFFFQASGRQKKMQKLYSRSRLLIIIFLYTCTFASLASPMIGWATQQSGPCVHARSHKLVHLGAKFQLPSTNMVLGTVISLFVFNVNIKDSFHFLDSQNMFFRKCSIIFGKLFTKILACIILFLFFIIELYFGKANILQLMFSIFFGCLLDFFVNAVPILVSYILSLVLFVSGVLFLIFNPRPMIISYAYDEIWDFILSGFSYLFFTDYILYFFIKSRKEISWMSTFNDFLEDKEPEMNSGVAVFGEFDLEDQLDKSEDIKSILMNDIRDSSIATSIQILMSAIHTLIIYLINPKE
ncbi:hypothetical protein TRFO_31659 [Tritrichomonas foetus]|uniref:Transmembrane protein n=1 Tax=Tritrichomonas foetus TaxID=1144522 RepID=A0A1J4JW43_9EUKA|nr:hypothetical protein TRFO_31659 [Tritrichomonas foetus]|eukprot:OHT01509.1 hypothetical protein TRFO_31659 [Tritrichomonas foetus]